MIDEMHSQDALHEALEVAAHHDWLRPHLPQLRPVLLADRKNDKGRRFVLRLTGVAQGAEQGDAIDVVVKGDTTGADIAGFMRDVEGHRHALDILGPEAVPDVLSVHPDTRSLVLHHIPGRSAHQMLELADLGLADRCEVLAACGTWLGRFHRKTLGETRLIKPDAMLRWAETMRRQAENRSVDVPRRDLFLACAAQIPDMAEKARGQETLTAATHGDLHLRNLLITDQGAVGIDFGPVCQVATAHDLGKFLVRYHGWFDPDTSSAPVQAFWAGYGADLAKAARPALEYILPIQVLGDWSDIPKRREDRREGQQHRLQQILKFAEQVFAL
ncbi:phosphotransferase family protein [Aliiroseovarius crassostreae]|uniref:phosphotransferase family protein n=1 Tax=Aliiroseovarius crassostreae TaxID=154981 RepID=UPI0021FDF65A|nr:aminoglycoside phosphotransferase family protein [Aliiroseovarius crassostreae]UWQ08593.1 aminoglycoside phosphotransferase family protein [Aliiroseovarius crassostreae]